MEGSRIVTPDQIPPHGGKMLGVTVQLKKEVVVAAAIEVLKETGLLEKLATMERIEGLLVRLVEQQAIRTIDTIEMKKGLARLETAQEKTG